MSRLLASSVAAVLALATLTAAAPSPRLTLTADQQSAVLSALEDERHAEAVYSAILAKFGDVRPFSAIIRSERTHQARLIGLLNDAGVAVPTNPFADGSKAVTAPATLVESCRIAADAEIANAALYDGNLLPRVAGNAEVTVVFKALSTASTQNHLPAFQRCAAGGAGRGRSAADMPRQGRGAGVMPSMIRAAFSPIPW